MFEQDDDFCMKISDDNNNYCNPYQMIQGGAGATTITSTADLTTPSKSISKLDLDYLENKIKKQEKQIDCIKN